MRQVLRDPTSRDTKEKVAGDYNTGFTKGAMMAITKFYESTMVFMDEGKAMGIMPLDFSGAFDMVLHNVLDSLGCVGLDEQLAACSGSEGRD